VIEMLSRELQAWLDKQSESVIVEITRSEASIIRSALARAVTATRQPERKQMFDGALMRWINTVDWGEDD
jgi:hypothetical protein